MRHYVHTEQEYAIVFFLTSGKMCCIKDAIKSFINGIFGNDFQGPEDAENVFAE